MKFKILAILLFIAVILSSGGCTAQQQTTQTANAASVYAKSDDAPQTPELTLSSDSNEAVEGKCPVGKYIKLIAGKNSNDKYTLMTKIGESGWQTEKRNVSGSIMILAPSEPCFFEVRLVPSDIKKSSDIRSFIISVYFKTGEKLADNGSKLSTKYVCCGNNSITAIPSFKGGTPPYQYSYKLVDASFREKDLQGYADQIYSNLKFSTDLGRYEIKVIAKDSDGNVASTNLEFSSNDVLPMKNIYQYSEPALPTGCEATALTSCLNYFDFKVTKNDIADKYIKKVKFTEKNGELIGGDPETEFAGDPNSENSYGCFSQCIADAANSYFDSIGSNSYAETVDLKSPEEMYEYLESGQPIIIWSTMFMWETCQTDSWKTKDGKAITWLCNEHCYVLTGMNPQKNKVGVADPMTDTDMLTFYDAEEFLRHYRELGSHAVIINVR